MTPRLRWFLSLLRFAACTFVSVAAVGAVIFLTALAINLGGW